MIDWTLERFAYLPSGTLGELRIEGQPKFWTVERPWRDNAKGISCIPEGEYALKPHMGRIQPAIWIDGVPGRTAILIHAGNTMADLQGCIAPGLHWTCIDAPKVLNSKAAMASLMSIFADAGKAGVLRVVTKRAITES